MAQAVTLRLPVPRASSGEQEQGPRAACLPGLQSQVLADVELDSVGLRGTEATKGQRAWEAPPAVLPAQGSRGVSLAHSRGPLCSHPRAQLPALWMDSLPLCPRDNSSSPCETPLRLSLACKGR